MNDLIILAMLLDGPKHGYRLKQEARTIFGKGELHNNLVYPLLHRFTSQGWVTKKSAPGERGQVRQQYALTTLGRQVLLEKIRDFTEPDARSAEAFRTRVGFFAMLAEEDRERILGLREEFLRERDERLGRLQKTMSLGAYGAEVVGFTREQLAAERAWIGRLRRVSSKQERRS